MYTDQIDPSVLALHGRLRLLRGHRNQEAQKLRQACESMHTTVLAVVRAMDANAAPLSVGDMRNAYRRARNSERELAKLDAEREEVEQQLTAHMR